MLVISPTIRIYIFLRPAAMRCSLDGLSVLAREEVKGDPILGHLFVFRNRLKVLLWDRNGFYLLHKRLERGCFSFPEAGSGRVAIDDASFQHLLGGLSLERVWNRQ